VRAKPARPTPARAAARQLVPGAAPSHTGPRSAPDELLGEIESLYRAHFGRFLRVAAAVVGDAEGARDAVQDAFASAIRHRRDYRGDGPLEAWLWRTVLNTACKLRLRLSREVAGEAREDDLAESSDGESAADVGLRSLVAALPERQRLIVFLRYYADLDYHSIAEALAIEPGTVGAALNAARAALRPALEHSP
jgi:RNA polymerase sigma-70 factor (ECF subfamily)